MKNLSLILLMTCLSFSSYAALKGASNITDNKVILSVQKDEESQPALVVLNLKNAAKEKISLPKDLGKEEIMGLLLFPEHVVMISQWTTGGGKNPHIHEYSFKDKKWKKPSELSCLSFDTVEVKASDLSVECEEGGVKKTSLSFKAEIPLKLVLPLESDKKGNLQYKLSGGSMFSWKTIDFQEGKKPKKSFSSEDLLKEK